MRKTRLRRVKYENPPIIEAVCELRFVQGGVQPVLIPGRFYERVKGEYSVIEMKMGVGIQEGKADPTIITQERTVFRNPTANRLVQLSPGMLAVNQLRPYSDYASFRREIEARLTDYRAVADIMRLTRVGLRYINLLTVPDGQTLESVLHLGFKVPGGLTAKPDPYFVRLELPYESHRDRLILIVAKSGDDLQREEVMLDLDYVIVKPEQIEQGELLRWVDAAHETIEDVFHTCVTQQALASFRPVQLERGKL